MKTYLNTKILEKLGRLMHPNCLSWIHLILLVAHFVWHPNNMANSYGSIFLRCLITMKQSLLKTLVTPITRYMTQIYRHITLKKVVTELLSPNMLDMI